ncbi:MAG: UbiA family prenyltransferase [Desulfobacterales bacterium]|nr:UbiA family prenyltransferase [Deltaproteobacteria bacterium]NNL42060.1 UbiA family prenyltransferase [Desulfobacterales bacterium]
MKTNLPSLEVIIPEKLQFFLALSRTQHGVLDMMSPVFAVLVYMGRIPDLAVILIGIMTVFSGYTCVYALNDIVGLKNDKKNIDIETKPTGSSDLDAVFIRHPLAQGNLGLLSASIWAAFWGITALVGAYYLNPVCVLIFVSAAVLEVLYCFLLKITFLRIIVTGFVKSAGPIAAVFAVDPAPEPLLPMLIFVFHFLWEGGGQNIPNDYMDMENDKRLGAKTLPLKFGRNITSWLITGLLMGSLCTMVIIFYFSPIDFNIISYGVLIFGSFFLLIFPSLLLNYTKKNEEAMILFNKASYYPLFLSILITIHLII